MRLLFVLGLLAVVAAASAKNVRVLRDVIYTSQPTIDVKYHTLDAYLPKDRLNYPVLLFIHGGAWCAGDKAMLSEQGYQFARQGIGFVAINYRLSPHVQHPAHIHDVASAFAWVYRHLGAEGANLQQLYVGGHSAGGHLSALLGTDPRYLRAHGLSRKAIRGLIPISGFYALTPRKRLEPVFGTADAFAQASPIAYVQPNLPPLLVLYASDDRPLLVRQAQQFRDALVQAHAPAEVIEVPERTHFTIMWNMGYAGDLATGMIVSFIRKQGGFRASLSKWPMSEPYGQRPPTHVAHFSSGEQKIH